MKKLVLLAWLFMPFVFWAAPLPEIIKCREIPSSGVIEAGIVSGAIAYEFKLTNVTTSQSLVINTGSNSIGLAAFNSILTYPGNYHVIVRANVGASKEAEWTEWSDRCSFKLTRPSNEIKIESHPCDSYIESLTSIIQATLMPGADCYTFYVKNLTTGQQENYGCNPSNSFSLSNLSIPFNSGDVITIQVGYTINHEEIAVSQNCKYFIEIGRQFCEIISEEVNPETDMSPTGQKTLYGNVGSKFNYAISNSSDGPYYAPALWDGDLLTIETLIQQLLLDLDDFLLLNTVDPSCGNTQPRMRINFQPYPQTWVDLGLYTGALAVASQHFTSYDINYLDQGCTNIPNVHLFNQHGGYGDFGIISAGTVYINPAIGNFNFNYTASSFTGYDLYSILLHEITHILGFSKNDMKFKEHLEGASVPFENPGTFDCGQHPTYMTMGTATCSYPVYFNGDLGNYPVYAPTTFSNGSSLSHFPDVCGSTTLGNHVMNPGISPSQIKRQYEQVEVNALQDIDYNFNPSFNGATYTINNTPLVVSKHDGLSVQAGPDEGFSCSGDALVPLSTCPNVILTIKPLINDINADIIIEAVVKTGAANATVTIVGTTELDFDPSLPGLYTIGYIAQNTTTGNISLPTYIQVWVPACGGVGIDDVTCHDSPNCNQICFNSIYDHTLLRGNYLTQPSGFGLGDNSFTIGCNMSELDQTSTLQNSYSSLFFFADIDAATEYSISFDRSYTTVGPALIPDPGVDAYVYLVKSTDMIGLVNQSSNNFAALPTDKQLIYHDNFDAGNEPVATFSTCFVADDEYDMLVFYTQQDNGTSFARRGKTTFANLEFMEKEFIQDVLLMSDCIPAELNMGLHFCALASNQFEWFENSTTTIVSSSQTYNPGMITSELIEDYTFTMSYPTLPTTVTTPIENLTCSESYTIHVDYLECCAPGNSITHPVVPSSVSRTFGEDVDSDNNGALYYTGEFPIDIGFGTTTLSPGPSAPIGFIAKFYDDCVEWLEQTPYRYSQLDVSNSGKIFMAGASTNVIPGYTNFSSILPTTGLLDWTWNLTSGSPVITDFILNETLQEIIIVGQCAPGFQYGAAVIGGTSSDVFILKIDFFGNYIFHNVVSTTSTSAEAKVSFDSGDLNLAFSSTNTDWTVAKVNYASLALLSTPTQRVFQFAGNHHITSLNQNSTILVMQFVTDANITDVNTSTIIATPTQPEVGHISFNSSFSPSPIAFQTPSITPLYFTSSMAALKKPDMDVYSNTIYLSYSDLNNTTHVESWDIFTNTQSWTQPIIPVSATSDWVGTRSIRGCTTGIYNTGSFFNSANASGTIINANAGATTMYGVKYDFLGNLTASPIYGGSIDNDQLSGSTNSKAHLDIESSNKGEQKIKIYPNPSNAIFTIEVEGEFHVLVQDMNGKRILTFNTTNQNTFDLSDYAPGIYQVILNSDSKTETFKIIKID